MALAPERTGIGIRRHFTRPGEHPYDSVEWVRRDARITNFKDGSVAFEQPGVEFPASWSQNAVNIVAQKYFRTNAETGEKERSVRQMADRVADTITGWGERDGYFATAEEREAFRDELKYLIVHQMAAFNSPVWFNIGVPGARAQAAACFILSVHDDMSSILNWYVEEGTIFKGGSGSGINLSKIRSSKEEISGGGVASGPVTFMRGADASAGTIKSGGTTRRAAKMVILDVDHPDVEEFVWCKAQEERKARALRDAGFDVDLDGRDSFSLQYQNANNSVRVSDEFMEAVVNDEDWPLRAVTTGEALKTVRARDLLREIAQAAWECADPGVQYDTTINRWHTAANTGPITASNPCSEYMHLDNSSCNLASINLLQFLPEGGDFDVEGFEQAVEVVFTAQEILVGNADYPTDKIAETSRRFRQLGLGFANLGALLMALGLPYDSDEGRAWAGAITALMTGHAYATSARTAARMGPFAGFAENREHMLRVLDMHRGEVAAINEELVPPYLLGAAQQSWDEACDLGRVYGVRNSQASVAAPTGTISFLMDCDTTGIEPDLGLVKTKKLVGGGTMSIVNQTVPRALRRLGYTEEQVAAIVAYVDENKTIVGAPDLRAEHLPVFACSMGDNAIHYMGHIRMMAACQPFLSGAISKCVTSETLLSTGDGLVRIGGLHRGEAPDTFRDHIAEVASLGGTEKTDAFYYGGVRPVRAALLHSGHRITGTPNHRLLVGGEGPGLTWKRLDELDVGDMVAVRYGADMWSTVPAPLADALAGVEWIGARRPREMTPDLAFVLGAFAAGGRVEHDRTAVAFPCPTGTAGARLADALDAVFGLRGEVAGTELVVAAAPVAEAVGRLAGSELAEQRIPDAVLRSPRATVLAYLEGLSLRAEVSAATTPRWALCHESAGLLDDLQAVLTNLGVVHGRIERYDAAHADGCGGVCASGAHAQRLVTLVPFVEPEKAERAAALRRVTFREVRTTADVVPGVDPRALYDLIPREATAADGTPVRSEFAFLRDPRTSRVSRRVLERVAAVPGVELPAWLRSVLADGLHFSPVASVDDAGEREVFDVSVPATQAFVGNGIVNHNTVNMPEQATVEEVEQLYLEAWGLGLKAVAIYRDNCKVAQPLAGTTREGADAGAPASGEAGPLAARGAGAGGAATEAVGAVEKVAERAVRQPVREKLPRTRTSKTFEFRLADCKGFVTIGEYADGRPGEIFMKVSKQGSTLAGIMDAFAKSISYGLQYGVPLRAYVETFINMRFEPAGMTDDPDIRFATSLMDYIFRRLGVEYLSYEERAELGVFTIGERTQPTLPGVEESVTETAHGHEIASDPPSVESAAELAARLAAEGESPAPDAPLCMTCGVQMLRAGSCHACPSCGATSGCS